MRRRVRLSKKQWKDVAGFEYHIRNRLDQAINVKKFFRKLLRYSIYLAFGSFLLVTYFYNFSITNILLLNRLLTFISGLGFIISLSLVLWLILSGTYQEKTKSPKNYVNDLNSVLSGYEMKFFSDRKKLASNRRIEPVWASGNTTQCAGKTSIIQRYTNNVFSNSYKATIGVDFFMKDLKRDNEIIKLQLWDIAGQEMFRHMTRVYYRDSVAALLVFDVDSRSSFEVINEWKKDIDEKVRTNTNSPIPVVLCANKIDLVDEESSWNKTKKGMDKICEEQGYIGWFETSAKTDQNISNSIEFLLDYVLDNKIEKSNSSTKKDKIVENLGEFEEFSHEDKNQDSGCC
ncbi:ras-related protein rab-32 [Anaeramoeba flamelloides]|uniref:Ras-related protein rab-32 n=1 Tax=Anaeramoeba flamelloides TaxID=1746091 RepID=A0ABQ8X6H1_9EUKA|nr:ras-related protein rab-32 [Anaeramoeba flamelloides]